MLFVYQLCCNLYFFKHGNACAKNVLYDVGTKCARNKWSNWIIVHGDFWHHKVTVQKIQPVSQFLLLVFCNTSRQLVFIMKMVLSRYSITVRRKTKEGYAINQSFAKALVQGHRKQYKFSVVLASHVTFWWDV